MTTKKKIILLTAVICYTCILYGFLTENNLFMMIAVIAFGVLMSAFSLQTDVTDPEAVEKLRRQLDESKKQNAELTERVSRLTGEKERFARAMEEAITAKNEAVGGQEALQKELARAESSREQEKEREQTILSNFLPSAEKELTDETIDIIRIAQETVKELEPFAEKVHLEIRISTPEEKILVKADPSRLRIMFRNIIDNSIKYMNRAGVLVITISNLGDDIFIVLKDNGNGLSENETAHIFELNYQGSNRISGNGLGLTQAKAIVEYYGGTIYAKSHVGRGMGIYVQLPTD